MIDAMQASFAFSIYGKPTIDHWYNGHGGTKIGAFYSKCVYTSFVYVTFTSLGAQTTIITDLI